MEKEMFEKEPEKTKERTKEEILLLSIDDWGNEFIKILSGLELSLLKKDTGSLFSRKGEKREIKDLREKYGGINEKTILELESEYEEFAVMREAVEKSAKILSDVYELIEKSGDKKTNQFWKDIAYFQNRADEQWKRFEKNRDKLRKKYEHQ